MRSAPTLAASRYAAGLQLVSLAISDYQCKTSPVITACHQIIITVIKIDVKPAVIIHSTS